MVKCPLSPTFWFLDSSIEGLKASLRMGEMIMTFWSVVLSHPSHKRLGAAASFCALTAAVGLSQPALAQFVEVGPSTSLSTVPSAPNNLNSNTLVTGMARDPVYGAANMILQARQIPRLTGRRPCPGASGKPRTAAGRGRRRRTASRRSRSARLRSTFPIRQDRFCTPARAHTAQACPPSVHRPSF